MGETLLSADSLDVFYGKAQALHQVSITVERGQCVAVVGRNGVGKTTLMKALCGLLPVRSGNRYLDRLDLGNVPIHVAARMGVSLVPDNRQIFPTLTVRDNLKLATLRARPGPWNIQRVFDVFPRLEERSGFLGQLLSGGEQQMLAVGRALVTNPQVLLLDEPTEGLAPVVVNGLVQQLRDIASEGIAMVVVEQNFRVTEELADVQYVMDAGRMVWRGSKDEFLHQREAVQSLVFS